VATLWAAGLAQTVLADHRYLSALQNRLILGHSVVTKQARIMPLIPKPGREREKTRKTPAGIEPEGRSFA